MSGANIVRTTFGGDLTDWYTLYDDEITYLDLTGAGVSHELKWTNMDQFAVYETNYI
jgi:hypothetical protein